MKEIDFVVCGNSYIIGYIKEANYRLPGTNTTKCYTIGKIKTIKI